VPKEKKTSSVKLRRVPLAKTSPKRPAFCVTSCYGRIRKVSDSDIKSSTGTLNEGTPTQIKPKLAETYPLSHGASYQAAAILKSPGKNTATVFYPKEISNTRNALEKKIVKKHHLAPITITEGLIKQFEGQRKTGHFKKEIVALKIKSANLGFSAQVGEPPKLSQECCHIFAFMFGGIHGKEPNEFENLVIGSKYFNSQMLVMEMIIRYLVTSGLFSHVKLGAKLSVLDETRVAKRITFTMTLPVSVAQSTDELSLKMSFDAQTSYAPSRLQAYYFYTKIIHRVNLEKTLILEKAKQKLSVQVEEKTANKPKDSFSARIGSAAMPASAAKLSGSLSTDNSALLSSLKPVYQYPSTPLLPSIGEGVFQTKGRQKVIPKKLLEEITPLNLDY
jgi:hypothetical protein